MNLDIIGVLVAVLGGILLAYYCLFTKRARRLPKGPHGLPFVGYLPFFGPNLGKTFTGLGKKYGPMFTVKVGTKPWIILTDFDLINKVLVQEGNLFSGRPLVHRFENTKNDFGMTLMDDGDFFRRQKDFAKKSLSRYTHGENVQGMISVEMNYLAKEIESKKNNSFSFQVVIAKALANIISRVCIGSRLSYEDPRFKVIVGGIIRNITHESDDKLVGAIRLIPFFRYFPVFSGVHSRAVSGLKDIKDNIRKIIHEQKATTDPKKPRGFIDEYLMQVTEDERGQFPEEQLVTLVYELYNAGTRNMSAALSWTLLSLVRFPQQQEIIWKEIEEVIGNKESPSLEHQKQMPFTRAFIHESTRFSTIISFNVPHKTTKEVSLHGFDLPKDTTVIPALWAVHHDTKHFKDPEQFRPERFIDAKGCFVPSSHVIPFSLGPRACLGEQLARKEIFLFLVGILQKFKIVPDPEKPLPSLEEGVGTVYRPKEFYTKFLKR